MDTPKKFLHDRFVLLFLTMTAALVVIGLSVVLLRFDVSKNPTTIVAYRPNVSGAAYQSGKPIDVYALAVYMAISAIAAIILSSRIYAQRRSIAMFILASDVFLLILAIRVAWSIISIQ
jgi:hypothetical protein